jgi:hypothetical protein
MLFDIYAVFFAPHAPACKAVKNRRVSLIKRCFMHCFFNFEKQKKTMNKTLHFIGRRRHDGGSRQRGELSSSLASS